MRRILIANRGEIARRVIRSARTLGLETVAVYAEPDAQALHVTEADTAFALGGRSSAQSYLRIDRLLEAARASGADALHPGYGFLSENADFAAAVQAAGLLWIGPPPAAIQALGSKAAAKALALAQRVPCLPGYAGPDQSEARFAAEAESIGYPLMVKAVAGGGGRGMRLVQAPAGLQAALAGARSEALSAFGNGELLIERALLRPRHVEVQVFADQHGHCIHLGERDCSVQRRHQKIIEEAPSPAVDAALRERMGACAVALAQAAGYVGAGTVEFLLEAGQFYLMEMNTRLQVEHPVTEALTGLDLVEWQLRVARGEALPLRQDQVRWHGHAIEVRLCAEDEQFQPHTGPVLHFAEPEASHFEWQDGKALRFDHALASGAEVSPHYDAMLGKLIARADTREAAIERLRQGLARTELLGLPSNRAFLSACLDHPEFRAGTALIPFLDEHAPALRDRLLQEEQSLFRLCAAVPCFAEALPAQALANPLPRPLRLRHRDTLQNLTVREQGQGEVLIEGETAQRLGLKRLADGSLQCSLDGVSRRLRALSLSEGRWHLQSAGVDLFLQDLSLRAVTQAGAEELTLELRAPFNGRVVSVSARPGQRCARGEALLVIESMKLEHSLGAPGALTLTEVLVEAGEQVKPGQLLIRFAAVEGSPR